MVVKEKLELYEKHKEKILKEILPQIKYSNDKVKLVLYIR